MTELLIDGVAVELPSQFSIAVKRENPFFTKSGEYTYDIELSLQSPINAKLYKFLQRINSVADIKEHRKAVLRADNRVYIDGTEVITGWTDENVQIQLVSGNAELNYLADDKTLISELTMPVSSPLGADGKPERKYIEKLFPEVDFALPIVARPDGSLVNEWILQAANNENQGTMQYIPKTDAAEFDYIPQPYLCAYIRAVCKGIGYELTYNAIEDTPYKYACIIHSQPTFAWAKMLPGITARDFLMAVENTFNVSFKVDFRHHTAELLLNRDYFRNSANAFVGQVADEYECAFEDEHQDEVAYTADNYRLEYDLPSTKYYNEAALTDFVKQVALIVDKSFDGGYFFYFKDGTKSKEKFYLIDKETCAARYDGSTEEEGDRPGRIQIKYHYADFFGAYTKGKPLANVKMKIIPAEIVATQLKKVNGQDVQMFYFPAVVAGDTVAKAQAEMTLDELLGMDKANEGDAGRIRVALYRGPMSTPQGNTPFLNGAPMAFTDYTIQGLYNPLTIRQNSNPPMSLRPAELAELFFSGGYDIDIKHAVRFKSFDSNLFDASSIFLIHNRRFLCRDIEYTIGPNGREGAWVGTFYPVKLEDAATSNPWILADGRWRDEGLWLDDGRWID